MTVYLVKKSIMKGKNQEKGNLDYVIIFNKEKIEFGFVNFCSCHDIIKKKISIVK